MTTVVTITEPPIITVTPDDQVVTVNITEQPPTAVTIASGVRTLANLSDVALSSPTDDQVLTYDDVTGKWVNQSVAVVVVADVTELTTNTGNAGEMVRVAVAGGLEYRTTAQVLADIGAETAGAAATVQGNLNTHTADTSNPHVVTPTQLGLVIGTDVQAYSGNLADIAGLAPGAGEDGYSIVWDNDTSAFVLTEVTSGGGAWGTITGTLSDQTDLQTALDAKVDIAGDTITGQIVITGRTTTEPVEIYNSTGALLFQAPHSGNAVYVTVKNLNVLDGQVAGVTSLVLNSLQANAQVISAPVSGTTSVALQLANNGNGVSTAVQALWRLGSSTSDNVDIGKWTGGWNVNTHASRAPYLTFTMIDHAAERTILEMRANGSAGAIGFLGATPVARAAHIADAAGDDAATVNAILVVLENLGFIATS